MAKIILRTTLKTLLGLVIALLIIFLVLSFGFPSQMASLFEKMGAYGIATNYASLSYAYKNDADSLERCARDSILAGDDEDIVKYCTYLAGDDGFGAVCEKNGGESYRQYIYGKLAASLYKTGDADGALNTVAEALDGRGFPENNAAIELALCVVRAEDGGCAARLSELLDGIEPEEGERGDYEKVKNILNIGDSL